MKKLTLGVFALIAFILSCQKNETHRKSSSTVAVTLNGINKEPALEMIEHFGDLRFNDSAPLKTNVWFDRATVEHIYNLVKSESGDVIRIYFISDINANAPPLKKFNSVGFNKARCSKRVCSIWNAAS